MSAKKVGLRLREARKQQGFSLEEARKATLIRIRFLKALEEGNFGLLPSPVQVRGFLKGYAEYLGIDSAELFGLLEEGAEKAAQESIEADQVAEDLVESVDGQTESVFAEIGEELRERRELLDLQVGEIEERIRISEHHLERLEKGEFDLFPSPTQARGMLHNYANFLGLDSDALLLRYAEGIQSRFSEQQEQEQQEAAERKSFLPEITLPAWLRRILSRENLAIGFIAVGLISLFIWGLGRIVATSAEQNSPPTAPALADLLLSSPTVAVESTSEAGNGSDTSGNVEGAVPTTPNDVLLITVEVANPRNVEIQLVPNKRVWVRVTADGDIVYEGRLAPGENYAYSANAEVLVFTGDASALRVFLNGQDLGVQGIEGEVVNLLFSAEGLATPTPSPTPTIDPNAVTETPTPTVTPSPSVDAGDSEQ